MIKRAVAHCAALIACAALPGAASGHPSTVIDHRCNGPQNDVSVHEMGGKRFLFQSIDFTNLRAPREVAFSDIENETGKGDELSSYWYNGRIFFNSGLNRRGGTVNRGVDVYRLTGSFGREPAKAERWSRSNPQTPEAWQAP